MLVLANAASADEVRLQTSAGPVALQVVSWRELPFRSVVRQQYDYSCGSAAVATLLRHHYSRSVTERDVFEAMYVAGDQARIRREGFSLLDMQGYLRGLGYDAEGYRVPVEQLATFNAPAITLINVNGYRHFVVIKGFRDGRILVGDPALGLHAYRLEEFQRGWSGVVFLIRNARGAYNQAAEWETFPRYRLEEAGGPPSPAAFTRELPPLYQITPINDLGGLP